MVDRTGGMGSRARQSKQKTDKALHFIEQQILNKTIVDFEALRPQVSNTETFDKLITIVNDATTQNGNMATLQSRISELGEKGAEVLMRIGELIK